MCTQNSVVVNQAYPRFYSEECQYHVYNDTLRVITLYGGQTAGDKCYCNPPPRFAVRSIRRFLILFVSVYDVSTQADTLAISVNDLSNSTSNQPSHYMSLWERLSSVVAKGIIFIDIGIPSNKEKARYRTQNDIQWLPSSQWNLANLFKT